jgi:hypothetical protein
MFLAARLYLADSVFSEDDSWPMPMYDNESDTAWSARGLVIKIGRAKLTVQTVSTPKQVFHVLGHDPRHVL